MPTTETPTPDSGVGETESSPIPEQAPEDNVVQPEQPVVEQERPESEPLRESIDTVGQMMDRWRQEYETADGPVKQELAYRLIRMGEALALSGLRADEVKIRESAPGVLGFYVPATGEIAITPAGLSLPAEHFGHVLVHEATHAGKTTGREIHDEGLTEMITTNKVPDAMSGIYEPEQRAVQEAFSKIDMDRVLDRYDFDRPEELIELYLQTEWQDAWRNRWERELKEDPLIETDDGRKELLNGSLKDWAEKVEEVFEAAAPRLFAKAKEAGFDFSQAHAEIFTTIVEKKETSDEKKLA